MNERVVEILLLIMNQIRGDMGDLNKLELLSQDLLNRGYSQNEISSAFSWLFDRINSDFEELLKDTRSQSGDSYRVLHELEQMVISSDAFGYLLQLQELQLLSDMDLEQAIERAMMLGIPSVGLPEMKTIVASLLAGSEQNFENMLYVSDEIKSQIH